MTFLVNHAQATDALKLAIKSNVVAFIQSQPALGKSSIVKQLAADLKLEVIDLRLSQLQPYDLAGLVSPSVDKTNFSYLPLDMFPLENTPLPEGTDGWLLFLDEFNSADKYTAAAAYKLLLDREIGNHKLHPNVRIICAGNRLVDGAITNNLGSAIQSRVTHLELTLDIKQWLAWLDKQTNWNKLIYPFLSFKPTNISNFDPSKEVLTYASPRTWEMLSKQLDNGLLDLPEETYIPIIMGTVGESAGQDFISFISVFGSLPSIQEIEADPNTCPIPANIGAKWALGIHLADNIHSKNENAILTYLDRIEETDIRVVAQRVIIKQYPQIRNNPMLQKSALALRNQMVK